MEARDLNPERTADAVMAHRAWGAPVMLSIAEDHVSVWQVRPTDSPRLIARHPLERIATLFDEYAERWSPAAMHRVKAMGQPLLPYQLDFVDLGLIPAIASEIHTKLDRLLRDTIAELIDDAQSVDAPTLVKLAFRLLAGKILADRQHPISRGWDLGDAVQVLNAIAAHYSFNDILPHAAPGVSRAWDRLRSGDSFRNIAADDLAFVYEHTLVTQETRDRFDTHSTPRQMAEHILSAIDLRGLSLDEIRVYEPFCGAGVLLVSALRQVSHRLPQDWDPERRHAYLTAALSGAEIDGFACEAATLSLILADYPNPNGWRIRNLDLFKPDLLADGIRGATMVLCNPPFQDFTEQERLLYPAFAARSVHKPIAILETALDYPPSALGFVMPSNLIPGQHYAGVRRRLEKLYGTVGLVALPDRVFNVSSVDAALVIVQDPRGHSGRTRTTSDTGSGSINFVATRRI